MSDQIEVSGEWRDRIALLELDYPTSMFQQRRTTDILSERLTARYFDMMREPEAANRRRVCILVIKPNVAGSPIVRAIFELYKVASADSALLICAHYPDNYLDSLTSLGLPALPGFRLANTLEEALEMAHEVEGTGALG